MAMKEINIFPCTWLAFQNLPKLVFFGLKISHLATLRCAAIQAKA
jgi:hypothetical protein